MLKPLRLIHADDLMPEDILDGGSTVIKVEDSYENVDMVAVYLDDEEDPRMMFNEDFVQVFEKI